MFTSEGVVVEKRQKYQTLTRNENVLIVTEGTFGSVQISMLKLIEAKLNNSA